MLLSLYTIFTQLYWMSFLKLRHLPLYKILKCWKYSSTYLKAIGGQIIFLTDYNEGIGDNGSEIKWQICHGMFVSFWAILFILQKFIAFSS